MDNQSEDNISNFEADNFESDNYRDKFEDEIRQSYLDLSDKMPLPPSNSFSRIMDTINAQEKKSSSSQSLLTRIFDFIRDTLMAPKVGWAVAGVQLTIIMFLFFSQPVTDMNTFQTLSINTAPGKSVEINIIFKENAMQKDISQLLTNSSATIINGPTENGLYILKVEEGHDFAIRLKAIADSKIVKFVSKRY